MASGSNGYFALDPAEPARRLAPGALAAQFGPGIIAAFEGRRRQAWAVHGADMLDAAMTGGASQACVWEMRWPSCSVLRRKIRTIAAPTHQRGQRPRTSPALPKSPPRIAPAAWPRCRRGKGRTGRSCRRWRHDGQEVIAEKSGLLDTTTAASRLDVAYSRCLVPG